MKYDNILDIPEDVLRFYYLLIDSNKRLSNFSAEKNLTIGELAKWGAFDYMYQRMTDRKSLQKYIFLGYNAAEAPIDLLRLHTLLDDKTPVDVIKTFLQNSELTIDQLRNADDEHMLMIGLLNLKDIETVKMLDTHFGFTSDDIADWAKHDAFQYEDTEKLDHFQNRFTEEQVIKYAVNAHYPSIDAVLWIVQHYEDLVSKEKVIVHLLDTIESYNLRSGIHYVTKWIEYMKSPSVQEWNQNRAETVKLGPRMSQGRLRDKLTLYYNAIEKHESAPQPQKGWYNMMDISDIVGQLVEHKNFIKTWIDAL